MRISREHYDAMVAHALRDAPNECCGLVATDGERVAEVVPAENAAASPLRFVIDPMEQYRLWTGIEDRGLAVGGVYHSHTKSAPAPSQTDVNFARSLGPDTLWWIVGTAGDEPEVRLWRIADGDVTELGYTVE